MEPVLDFASSGRSGRRNALPDILGSPAGVNPGDLPLKLAELSLEGKAYTVYIFFIILFFFFYSVEHKPTQNRPGGFIYSRTNLNIMHLEDQNLVVLLVSGSSAVLKKTLTC